MESPLISNRFNFSSVPFPCCFSKLKKDQSPDSGLSYIWNCWQPGYIEKESVENTLKSLPTSIFKKTSAPPDSRHSFQTDCPITIDKDPPKG